VHLPNWLSQRAALTPRRPALIFGGEMLTFADLDELVAAADRRLEAAGIAAGQRVATLYASSADFVVLVHALMRRGAVLVPLNTRLTSAELSWQLGAGAQWLLFDEAHAETAHAAARDASGLRLLDRESLTAPSALRPSGRGLQRRPTAAGKPRRSISNICGSALETPTGDNRSSVDIPPIDLDATHSIIHTSGTTGHPKGAMLTYCNHWWNAIGSTLNLGLREDDRWLACMPLFHVGGLAILWRSVICGIPVVLHEGFDQARVNRAIDIEGITIISVVATMLQRMLAERGDHPYPATLRCVLLGGGPAPRPLLEQCAKLGVPVFQTYGLTEAASQVATLAPEDALRKLGSAGKPLFPTELRIGPLDASVHDSDAGRAVGEIVIRGPSVFAGYLGESRREEDDWFHTGDLGYLDGEGYLYVLDRRDDLILSGGENIYPAEVEAVLLAHPAVVDAGVYGVPDEDWGAVPVAVVVPHDFEPVTESELIEFCRERLAGYKVPRSVRYLVCLPRNAAGKLQRARLRGV
jgi:O-succinylbenzoic acid--CoA ligase